MSNPAPTAEQIAAAEIAAQTITLPVTSENRNAVRRYLTALGVAYATAGRLKIADLETVAVMALAGRHADARDLAHRDAEAQPELVPAPAPAPVPAGVPADKAAALAAILELITPTPAASALDEKRVRQIVAESVQPPTILVKRDDRPAVEVPRQHYKFPLLLACLSARVPAWLVGPAGTSKTTAAHAAATALGLPFGAISVGPMTSKGDLFGIVDASGTYRETELVRRARDGGVFLFDEVDAGNPGVLTGINMLMANGSFATPAGMIERHPDFLPVFAANTYGTGACRQYVGRNQLDAATLDRGAFIDWPLDEGLEAAIVGVPGASPAFDVAAGGAVTAAEWLSIVRGVRARVAAAGIRHLITPRASIYGAQLAAAGVGRSHLQDVLLVKGLDDAARAKILAA